MLPVLFYVSEAHPHPLTHPHSTTIKPPPPPLSQQRRTPALITLTFTMTKRFLTVLLTTTVTAAAVLLFCSTTRSTTTAAATGFITRTYTSTSRSVVSRSRTLLTKNDKPKTTSCYTSSRSFASLPFTYRPNTRPFDVELLFATPPMANQGDNIIDGKAIAEVIRGEIKEEVIALASSTNITPGLAVVLVGNRTDSATYVRMKIKACEEVGIQSFKAEFGEDVTEEELIAKVVELNNNPKVHGILVQLPLPGHIHEQKVLDTILPEKDVDGLHPLNLAKLAHTNTHGAKVQFDLKILPYHAACTPQGCIELIERSGVTIEGKEAVVVGRSNIVGIPVSLLLLQKNATVTIVHSRTKDAAAVVKRADIVVAAVGRAEMVTGDWIKPGAIVIDVGINSVDDASSKKGYKLVGDVEFGSAKEVAGKITPVPGGVGPMTIAMLLRNTVQGARRSG